MILLGSGLQNESIFLVSPHLFYSETSHDTTVKKLWILELLLS
jgi:hypothetical protein